MISPDTVRRSSKAEIEDLIKARYSLVYVTSHEEARVEESLRKLLVLPAISIEVLVKAARSDQVCSPDRGVAEGRARRSKRRRYDRARAHR